jgi:hypothetical protein
LLRERNQDKHTAEGQKLEIKPVALVREEIQTRHGMVPLEQRDKTDHSAPMEDMINQHLLTQHQGNAERPSYRDRWDVGDQRRHTNVQHWLQMATSKRGSASPPMQGTAKREILGAAFTVYL